jgi:hypothetical protein
LQVNNAAVSNPVNGPLATGAVTPPVSATGGTPVNATFTFTLPQNILTGSSVVPGERQAIIEVTPNANANSQNIAMTFNLDAELPALPANAIANYYWQAYVPFALWRNGSTEVEIPIVEEYIPDGSFLSSAQLFKWDAAMGTWELLPSEVTGSAVKTTLNGEQNPSGTYIVGFNPAPLVTLTTNINPGNGGIVEISPTPNSSNQLPMGTVATLTARPTPGFGFTSWSGDASGSDNQIQVTMDTDKTVTATFDTISADDVFEENDSLDNPANLSLGLTENLVLRPVDDDWYRIQLAPLVHARITVSFDAFEGDVQAQLWDRRSALPGEFGFAAGESYSSTDQEIITYVNLTAPDELLLRVYGEGGASNPSYSINIETFITDDIYDTGGANNDLSCSVLPTLPFGTYNNLVGRDDDWYRVDVSGVNAIDVRADHFFFSGNMHLMVTEDIPGNCALFNNILPGGGGFSNFSLNNFEELTNVDVSGRNSVLVRVYGATRQTNLYNLTIQQSGTRSEDEPVLTDNVSPANVASGSLMEGVALAAQAIGRGADDSFEDNDSQLTPSAFPLSGPNTQVDGLVSSDEDWYALSPAANTHLRVRLLHSHAQGNLQLQLWDRRAAANDGEFGFPAGSSFSETDNEELTYVNLTAPDQLLLRVYNDFGYTGQTYSLVVEQVENDDIYDIAPNNNDVPCSAISIPLDTTITNLVAKDDDWYRLDVSDPTLTSVDIRADHFFFSGNLHIMVSEDTPAVCDAPFGSIIGGGFSSLSLEDFERVIFNVQGRDSILIRVYGATRQVNMYSLTVSSIR